MLSQVQDILPREGASERGLRHFQAWSARERFALVDSLCTVAVVCLPAFLRVVVALASVSWIQPASRSAIIAAFSNTRCLRTWRHAGKPQLIGSEASSCIWWSTTKASCKGFTLTPGNTDDRVSCAQVAPTAVR